MPELKRMRKVPASMILKIERIPQNTADNSSTNKRGFVITGNDMEDRRACISTKDVANFPVEATLKNMLEDEEERGYCSHESTGGDQWRDIPKASLPDPVGRQVNADRQTNDDMYHHQQELQTSAHETQVSCSCPYFVNRELKEPRRRRQQKPHKFAYLTLKNSFFARFARAFLIFWHFKDVLVLSTTWNDLFCSCVDDVSIWSQMFNFVFLCLACEASVSALFRSKGRAKNASRFISRAAKTKNLVPRPFFAPKQHGNACYAGYLMSQSLVPI